MEREKNDHVLLEMQKQDQLKQGFEIPELDQQGISSGSEEESEDYGDIHVEEIAQEDALEEQKVFEEGGQEFKEDFVGDEADNVLDAQLLENYKAVMSLDQKDKGGICYQRLKHFQEAYKAAVLYYFYYKAQKSEDVNEHPVISKLTELNQMVPFFLCKVEEYVYTYKN
jgi:hypothetical protein